MMDFSEKLTFLMHISETNNKQLAAVLSVDPSLISLMRTGKRRLPKNPAQVRKMAAYFARRCSAPFQRQALSEMLDHMSIGSGMPVGTLTTVLENWLQGNSISLAGSILAGLEPPAAVEPGTLAEHPLPSRALTDSSQTQFFFGPEGRIEVTRRVVEACREMESPGSILMVVDDNLEWLLSDYVMTRWIQSNFLSLVEAGFAIHQIVPPVNYVNRYAESLQFWMPLYATGKIRAYYYPRLRGNLYRHSLIVVPGCCVQYASAVGLDSTNEITVFSTDLKLVEIFEKQFHEHAALCRPALMVHSDYQSVLSCFREFFACRSSTVQQINTLSVRSMPRVLLEKYLKEVTNPIAVDTFQTYLNDLSGFEERLSRELFLDMCRLASPEEVISGSVPVAVTSITSNGQPCYTPDTYRIHLENILRLLEQYDNYYFLPLTDTGNTDYDLLVNEDGMALITRTAEPLITMEIRRQHIVTAFQEHLFRRADAMGYSGSYKEKIKMQLRTLIQRLYAASTKTTNSDT